MGREEDCGISLELGLPGGRKAGALSQGWDVMWGEGSRRWAQEEAQIRVTGGRVPQTHFSPSGVYVCVCVRGGSPAENKTFLPIVQTPLIQWLPTNGVPIFLEHIWPCPETFLVVKTGGG